MTWDRNAELDERQIRRYTLIARIRTDDVNDGPGTILAAVIARGIDIGTYYQEPNGYADFGARCRKIVPRVDQDDPKTWLVECSFSSEPPERTASGERGYEPSKNGQGSEGRQRSPELRQPEVSWDYEGRKKIIRRADLVLSDGSLDPNVAIRNSAAFPFDPPAEVEVFEPRLTVSRNELAYDPQIAQQYANKVNSDTFWGYPAGSARMLPPVAKREYENGLFFWRVTYTILFRTESPYWDLEFLDAGMHAIDGSGDAYRIVDRDGNPVNEPWPLDGEGGEAVPGTDDPVYFRYRPFEYAWIPFGPLGLE